MAYDRELADRIRGVLADQPSVREVSMFGGLSFMVNEKLTVGANAHGDLMIRCDPERVDDLLGEEAADWAAMNGRKMSKGWLVIGAEGIDSAEDLDFWIGLALEYNEKVNKKDIR
jgi:TfoX N-terminal domain